LEGGKERKWSRVEGGKEIEREKKDLTGGISFTVCRMLPDFVYLCHRKLSIICY
jgi:hypothetical protein